MRVLVLLSALVGTLLATPADAGLLREIVDKHQASHHGGGNVTRAQWKAYIKTVDGREISQSRKEKIVVSEVTCNDEKGSCSVSGYPYPQGEDFLPRITWRWVNTKYGLSLSRGDVISIYGKIDISDFLVFDITVE